MNQLKYLTLALCLITALATTATADTARFVIYADTTYTGTAGHLMQITDTYVDEFDDTIVEAVTFFIVEEAGHIRLVAERPGDSTVWSPLPADFYIRPAPGAVIGDTWTTLRDDFGRENFSTLNVFESTTVPAGTFSTAYCIQKPVDPSLPGPPVTEVRHFAWGVGMVREAWPMDNWADILTSYNVVGGTGYWPVAVGNWWEYDGADANAGPVSGTDDTPTFINLLHGNFPNPFNPSTKISFEMGAAGKARITVYDAAGRLVRTVLEGDRDVGNHFVTWDGRDESGRNVAAGVYMYRFEAGQSVQTRTMTLVK